MKSSALRALALGLVLGGFSARAASDLWIPDFGAWLGAEVPANSPANFSAHEARIGRQLDILRNYYAPGSFTALTSWETNYLNAGRKIMVSFKPAAKWSDAGGGNPTVNLALKNLAISIASVKPLEMMICVWHEPQNDVGTAGTAADYVNMWHNVRSIFDTNGATNVIWVWCLQGPAKWYSLNASLWPGNSYVDWVSWDMYQGSATDNLVNDETAMYNWMTTNSNSTNDYLSKPWAFTEWGSGVNSYVPTAAVQAATFNAMNTALNAYQFPRIMYVAYYDDLASTIQSGAQSAYNSCANSAYLLQQNPSSGLFADNFDDSNANGWTVDSGTWSVVSDGSDVYKQTATGGVSHNGSTSWTDYSAEVDIKPITIGSGTISLSVRFVDKNNRYFAEISSSAITIKKIIAGTITPLASVPFTATPGTWLRHFAFVAQGTSLEVLANGVSEVATTNSTFPTGAISLSSAGSAVAEFDNVLVVTR